MKWDWDATRTITALVFGGIFIIAAFWWMIRSIAY
jgi:hypothetical protein